MQIPLSFIYFVCVYPGCKTLREGRKSLFWQIYIILQDDRYNQSHISRAERLFKYDVICSQVAGYNSNKQNDPIDDALRGHYALASLPAGI